MYNPLQMLTYSLGSAQHMKQTHVYLMISEWLALYPTVQRSQNVFILRYHMERWLLY